MPFDYLPFIPIPKPNMTATKAMLIMITAFCQKGLSFHFWSGLNGSNARAIPNDEAVCK